MPNWPRAVLFDFDGVLVNSEPLHFQAFREVLAELPPAERIELTEDEYYRELIGFDDRGAIRHLFFRHDRPLTPKTMLTLLARKSGAMMRLIHRKQFAALPGAEQFVRGLWRHVPLAICSGALREEIEAMLEGVALRDCFSVITSAEDVTVGKPDPQGYLLTINALSEKFKDRLGHKALEPADCLIVEDAPTVIRSVREAGFPTLGVATSYPLYKLADANWQVRTLEPAEVAEQVPQLAPLILEA